MLNPADILLPLDQNISLFVVIVAAFCAVKHHLANFSPAATRVAEGMVFGLCAILAMMSPLPLVDGLFVDSRNIVIAVGSIMAGPIAGAVCAAMAALYRWQLGGIGVLPACVTMAVTLAQGTAFWLFYRARKRRPTPVGLAILGTLVGISSVLGFLLLGDLQLGLDLMGKIVWPMLLLVPLGTIVAGTLMLFENQRVALQAELKVSRQRLELALKGSQDGVFDYDLRSRKIWTSHRYREMRGYAAAPEVANVGFWRDLVIDEDRNRIEDQFADLEAGRIERVDTHMRVRHRSGRLLYVRSKAVSERDASGKVTRVVGSNTDETQRLEAEARLRNAIDSMDSGFAYFDADDRLILCNERFIDPGTREKYGNPVGHTYEEIMRSFAFSEFTAMAALPDREAWLQWRLERHRDPPLRPLEIQWTDGSWFSVLERRTTDGGRVGLWTDITDQKLRQAELEDSRSRMEEQATQLAGLAESLELAKRDADRARYLAEQANPEKSSFLASMSHELRTPLNAIIGFTDMIRTEAFGPIAHAKYADYVRIIGESGQHLLSLINDVLDLSKIEAGRMNLSVEVLSAHDICHQATGLMRELATARRVNLSGSVQDGCAILHGDQRAVKQILLNLISNAIKFSEAEGSVRLDIGACDEGALLSVTDAGVGLTEAELKTALEPYGQVDSKVARKSVGTGLGLPLVKRLVELHGGRFSISSSPGEGTNATMLLPWKRDLAPRALQATAFGR